MNLFQTLIFTSLFSSVNLKTFIISINQKDIIKSVIISGIWIVVTIIVSYYIVYLLEESLGTLYSKVDTSVTYGIGFCLLATAGKLSNSIYTYSECFLTK